MSESDKRRVLITELTGYLGRDIFRVVVYLKRFVMGGEESSVPVCFIGDTPFLLIEGRKVGRSDIDFFAVSQAPIIPYGDTHIEIDWGEGLKRYKENLKRVIKR